MSVKNDSWIRKQAKENQLINPFEYDKVDSGVVSYGVSSYGYDARLATDFHVFTNINNSIIDPKNMDESCFVDMESNDPIMVPPHSFVLARTLEYFKIPRDVLVICLGKSTYARCGLIVNVTPLEPEWEGHVTLELSNTTPLPVRVYPNEGICQFVFFGAEEVCHLSYADKKGKYMGQSGITLPTIDFCM